MLTQTKILMLTQTKIFELSFVQKETHDLFLGSPVSQHFMTAKNRVRWYDLRETLPRNVHLKKLA